MRKLTHIFPFRSQLAITSTLLPQSGMLEPELWPCKYGESESILKLLLIENIAVLGEIELIAFGQPRQG